jgi:Undecaprenyl-phosphate glucose phosphotransferase
MIRRKSQILCLWYAVWDLSMTALAWISAYYIRMESGLIPFTAAPYDFSLCLQNLPIVMVLSIVAYRLTGQYVVQRMRRLREEFVSVFKGVALMGLLVIAATFGLRNDYESRATILLFLLLTAALILTARRLSASAIRFLRSRGYNQTHSIIVGTGRVARRTARLLRTAHWMGIRNIGFVEDQPSRWTTDLDILGTTADLPRFVEKYRVSHVFIAMPLNRFHEARRIFDSLGQTLVEVQLVADIPELAGVALNVSSLHGLPLISLREHPHYGINVVVKRAMDVMLSAVGLVLLAPLLFLIAALVKLTSRGPIFYCQERCGLNGRGFQMLKFRSMRSDAEKESGAVWARKDDPRRTWFGTLLRQTSLDELPQLINVLKGDMSLVGPRPERPVFIQKFRKTIPNYHARHAVKAGITGWAQVHGWRGNTSLRKRVQFDLYYITHWTPWLDLRILWLTVWKGLVSRNAY